MELNQENHREQDRESSNEADESKADDSKVSAAPEKSDIRIRRWLYAVVIVLALIAGIVWFAIHEAGKIPEFYAEVLAVDDEKAKLAGQRFERNLVQLQNAARRTRPWKVEFTQEQVNGWFSSDLPEKFPDAIPSSISDPRVVFRDDEVKLAFKYDFRGAVGYVVLRADMFCTDEPNEIAIQIQDVKTGFVSLPIAPWMDRVADSIRKAGIPIYWTRDGESPVAVFTLPDYVRAKATSEVLVEAISIKTKKLVIAGKVIKIPLPEKEKTATNKNPDQA